MYAEISVLVICVELVIFLLLYNLHDCTFNAFPRFTTDLQMLPMCRLKFSLLSDCKPKSFTDDTNLICFNYQQQYVHWCDHFSVYLIQLPEIYLDTQPSHFFKTNLRRLQISILIF